MHRAVTGISPMFREICLYAVPIKPTSLSWCQVNLSNPRTIYLGGWTPSAVWVAPPWMPQTAGVLAPRRPQRGH